MFESLASKLSKTFEILKRKGSIKESDINQAMREVRVALLEADVSLSVVKDFISNVSAKAIGREVLDSISPVQQIIKIVNDELIEILGGSVDFADMRVSQTGSIILLLGLQGTGKTTTASKLALWYKKQKKRVLLASLDIYRPAAMQQLETLGKSIEVDVLPIVFGQKPLDIAKRAKDVMRKSGYDLLILDSAGRLHVDEKLMKEVVDISSEIKPTEKLLLSDAMMGQDAANVAQEFNEKIGITGVVLSRMDGDAKGGAALSIRKIANCPIRFIGVGEKPEDLQLFSAERMAGRILDKGDIVALVEKASQAIDEKKAEKLTNRILQGKFDLNDMLEQIRQLRKMGDIGGLMGLLPGMGKIKKMMNQANVDEKAIVKQEAIILSMTKKERSVPKIVNSSRRKRIAQGSGTTVQDVNKLMKQYQQSASMMKKLGKKGGKGMLESLMGAMDGGGQQNAANPNLGLNMENLPFGGGGQLPDELKKMLPNVNNKNLFRRK